MANEYLTVKQAQYLLEKWKADAVQKSGDTMSGKLILDGGLAIKAGSGQTSPPFFLCLNESFANGGNVGYVTKENMAAAIGASLTINTVNGSAITAPTATDTTICNTGSLAGGHYYVILASCNFRASNTTGRRSFFLATSNTGSYQDRFCVKWIAPTPGSNTFSQLTYITYLSSATTFYLRAYQNSGGNMSVQGGLRVLRLH